MTAATEMFLMPVMRFSRGVYSSVAPAESAIMNRSSGGSCGQQGAMSLIAMPLLTLGQHMSGSCCITEACCLRLETDCTGHQLRTEVLGACCTRVGRLRCYAAELCTLKRGREENHQDASGDQYGTVKTEAQQQCTIQRNRATRQRLQTSTSLVTACSSRMLFLHTIVLRSVHHLAAATASKISHYFVTSRRQAWAITPCLVH